MARKISVGLDLPAPADLVKSLDDAVASGFDYVSAPLFHPRFRRDADGISDAREGPGTRSDLVMSSERWSTCVVGKLSPWLDLDSPVTATRLASEKAFKQEVAWASHLTVPAVLTPAPSPVDCSNFAMMLNQTATATGGVHFWVTVPLTYAGGAVAAAPASSAGVAESAPGFAAASAPALPASSTAMAVDGSIACSGSAAALPAGAADSSFCGATARLLAGGVPTGPSATEPDALQRALMTIMPASSSSGAATGTPAPGASTRTLSSSSSGNDRGGPALMPLGSSAAASAARASAAAACGTTGSGVGGAAGGAAAPTQAIQVTSRARTLDDPWETWNTVRTLTECSPHVSAALLLTRDLPSDAALARWLGEPVKAAVLPTSIFSPNRRGFPTLPPEHQRLLLRLHRHRVQFVLSGRPLEFRSESGLQLYADAPYKPYLQFIIHVLSTGGSSGLRGTAAPPPSSAPAGSAGAGGASLCGGGAEAGAAGEVSPYGYGFEDDPAVEEFVSPYYDFLQAPLQPLADNLESQTYETFERDPVKYQQYEAAIQLALSETPADRTSVVMVVGAGRGPLVTRALRAAESAHRSVRVYAVEKNPNAVVTLRNLKATTWGSRVTIVSCDMRRWEAPELADILVSELLGSFGDNELSPECLDGAQRFLKPAGGVALTPAGPPLPPADAAAAGAGAASSSLPGTSSTALASLAAAAVGAPPTHISGAGVSIPAAYTSFLAPIMSSKLWNEVKAYKESKWFETAYVVKLFSYAPLAEAQPVFTFVHPNRAAAIDNRRYAVLRFTARTAGLIHGFAGYFDCTLHGDVHISINPASHSPHMMSWFPLYFPLREPVYAREGELIEARMWRCVSSSKVWYEWALTAPQVTPIHNPMGRSYYIGL